MNKKSKIFIGFLVAVGILTLAKTAFFDGFKNGSGDQAAAMGQSGNISSPTDGNAGSNYGSTS